MAGPDSSADEATWAGVVALHAAVERRLGKAVQARHGLGLSEFRALGHLAASDDGELRVQQLADLVGLNESSVSRLVARLEAAGLVTRDLCPDDGRGVYAVLGDEGRRRYEAARPTYRAVLAAALDDAASDADLAAVVRSLRHRVTSASDSPDRQ